MPNERMIQSKAKQKVFSQPSIDANLFIKQYPGEEQVALKVVVNVPGHWFDNAPDNEKRKQFRAEAVEYCDAKRFGTGQRATTSPAIRFQVCEDARDDPSHPGYWIQLSSWNRFRHLTYKDDREAEAAFIPTPNPRQLATTDEPAEDPVVPADGPTRPACYQGWKLIGQEQQVATSGRKVGKKVKVELWKCAVRGCPRPTTCTVVDGSTGVLFRHMDSFHPEAAATARAVSSHSKVRVADNGSVFHTMSFDEAFPHHVRFVLWIVLDKKHFHCAKSPSMREWIAGLSPRYVPPCRETCLKILSVIFALMNEMLDAAIAQNLAEVGKPHCGTQQDIWTQKNAKESFACLRVSMILLLDNRLHDVAPIKAFEKFPTNRHTGVSIGRWFRNTLLASKMETSDISLSTADGASNNKKAHKVLGISDRLKICGPHQLQRCVEKGLGTGGKKEKSSNPKIRAVIKRASAQSSAFHSSVITSKRLEEAQAGAGIAKSQVKTTLQQVRTYARCLAAVIVFPHTISYAQLSTWFVGGRGVCSTLFAGEDT